jgi:hypothetical protein
MPNASGLRPQGDTKRGPPSMRTDRSANLDRSYPPRYGSLANTLNPRRARLEEWIHQG